MRALETTSNTKQGKLSFFDLSFYSDDFHSVLIIEIVSIVLFLSLMF